MASGPDVVEHRRFKAGGGILARGKSGARGGGPGMRRERTQQAEERAVVRVNSVVVEELKWHSGKTPLPDFGVDVLTEIVAADNLVTGRLIGIQVKGGKSWFRRRKGDLGWVFREDSDHLAYWLGYSLPVIVVLVNEEREAFWQAITPETVTEQKAGFTVVVPRAQRFDRSALEPLLALARRGGGLLESLPEHYAVLPASAVRPLRRAEGADHLAAARLAERLASGRDHPDLTVRSLVAAQPTWLAQSVAAQDLWLTAGAYAEQHGHRGAAGERLRGGGPGRRPAGITSIGCRWPGAAARGPRRSARAPAAGTGGRSGHARRYRPEHAGGPRGPDDAGGHPAVGVQRLR